MNEFITVALNCCLYNRNFAFSAVIISTNANKIKILGRIYYNYDITISRHPYWTAKRIRQHILLYKVNLHTYIFIQ